MKVLRIYLILMLYLSPCSIEIFEEFESYKLSISFGLYFGKTDKISFRLIKLVAFV